MPEKPFSRNNHYVPRIYLKQWASEDGRIWTYRMLVPNSKIPKWKAYPAKGIGYHSHLYTRVVADGQTDEIEQWLDRDFEAPAERPLKKAVSESRLSPDDWVHLIRFLAAQDVRTPARLLELLIRWEDSLPKLMQSTLEDSVRELKIAKKERAPVRQNHMPHTELFPIRIRIERDPKSETSAVRVESVAGRGLWLFSIKTLLTKTVDTLLAHKWTILKSPKDRHWYTSDNPVIKLNYYRKGQYDMKGGWGNKGTEILFPISPNHLMYTKIGDIPPQRGTIISDDMAKMIQRFTVEHAHRFVFAAMTDQVVERIRPRTVDQTLFDSETKQWKRWHEENVNAESDLYK